MSLIYHFTSTHMEYTSEHLTKCNAMLLYFMRWTGYYIAHVIWLYVT